MRFRQLFASCCSACFELENDEVYYAPESYQVLLDGAAQAQLRRENVFSLFDLQPDTEYKVSTTLGDFFLTFRTLAQSAYLPVTAFGAVGDGVTDDTRAIQMAIDACPQNGRVTVPAGTYCVSPLLLKSDITLELRAGATLLGSVKESDYPIWPGTAGVSHSGEPYICYAWEGRPHACHQALLSAQCARNISIVGEGTLDGNAQNAAWWIEPKKRSIGRPRMVFTNNCDCVTLHGVSVCNSPSWNIHPYRCRNFGLYDIRVLSPKDSPNTDGFDPESCDGVEVIGARFSVGDDAIAIKSGKAAKGDLRFPCASHHSIRNCLMEFAHGAVVLGSEASGGVDTLSVKQCLFTDTDRGLRIKTRRGRGKYAVIDGVTFENISMRGVRTPLVINMFYYCDAEGKSDYVRAKHPLAVDENTPYMGNFTFRRLVCEDCHAAAGFFYGLPEQPIASVSIEDSSFSFDKDAKPFQPAMMDDVEPCTRMGLYCNNVSRVRLKNVVIDGVSGERVQLINNDSFMED